MGVRIIGISGSLRQGSFNTALLRAAAEVAPEGATIEVRTIHGIPLYDADVESGPGDSGSRREAEGRSRCGGRGVARHARVQQFDPGRVQERDRLAVATRSDIARVFRGRPVALMGASPGRFGTTLSQAAWLPVVRTLGMRPWFDERLLVFEARKMFDSAGKLTDAHTRERMVKFVQGFCAFVAHNGVSEA